MKYKYHVTTLIQKWWSKQNFGPIFKEKLDSFLKSEVELQVSKNVSPYAGKYLVAKFPGISSRPTFVWDPWVKGDATLYVLRAAYVHSDYDKEVTKQNQEAWINKYQVSEEEEKEIEDILLSMISSDTEYIPRELKGFSESEYGFISNPLEINHKLFEETIYETEEWVDFIKNDNENFSDFYNSAEVIESYIVEHLDDPDGWQYITFKDKIIFIYHDGKDWVLADIQKYDEHVDYNGILTNKKKPAVFRRGYPWTFLNDKDEWRDMELEKKSNMVLSEEQVGIVSGDILYPLFITGRAGSGKSTALQYLFAEIILEST